MSHPYCTWGRVIPVTPILSRREMCYADADGKAIIHKKGGWLVFINGGPGRPWLAASLVGQSTTSSSTSQQKHSHADFSIENRAGRNVPLRVASEQDSSQLFNLGKCGYNPAPLAPPKTVLNSGAVIVRNGGAD